MMAKILRGNIYLLKYHVYIARCHSDSLSFKVQQILLERIKGSNFKQIAWPC